MKLLRISSVAWLALVLLFGACGGGGGSSPTAPPPPPPPPPPPGVSFSAAGMGGPNSITLGRNAATSGNTLVLDVIATDVTALYGMAFDLEFPGAILSYSMATEGNLLDEMGATQTSFQVAETTAGNLVVGLSRLGDVPGLNVSGVLMTLEFTGTTAGTGNLRFMANELFNADGSVQPGVTWQGGSAQVSQ